MPQSTLLLFMTVRNWSSAREMMLDDFEGLLRWPDLNDWIGTAELPGSGPVPSVQQLAGGCGTMYYCCAARAPSLSCVARRGTSAMAAMKTMVREPRLLRALANSSVPHAKLYGVCQDPAIMDASFYIMAWLAGFSPRAICRGAMAPIRLSGGAPRTSRPGAALGGIDYHAVGSENYVRSVNWQRARRTAGIHSLRATARWTVIKGANCRASAKLAAG